MERTDILNALRLVRDYCWTVTSCERCEIKKECSMYLHNRPNSWLLKDDDV